MCYFHYHFGEWQWNRFSNGSHNREGTQERKEAETLGTCTKKIQMMQNLIIRFPDCGFIADSVFLPGFFFFSHSFLLLTNPNFFKLSLAENPMTQKSAVLPYQHMLDMLEIMDVNSRV